MAKVRTVEISESEKSALEAGYKQGKTHSFRTRCKAILLKSEGRTSLEVGRQLGIHQVTVNNCLNSWESSKMAGLSLKKGRGRKPKLEVESHGAQVRAAVEQERQKLSLAKATLENELGQTFHLRTLKRFLKNLSADTNASVKG